VEKDAYARVQGGTLRWVTGKLGYAASTSGFFFKLDPRGQTGTVTVTLVYTGEVGGTSTASAGVPAGTFVAMKKPTAVINIVPVIAKLTDPNAIVATLPGTETKVAMGATGLRVVSVGVPVTLSASTAEKTGPARSYAWTLTAPTASKAKLSASDQPTVKFTPDVPGYYKVDLVVRNELGESPMASVQIRADTYIGVEPGGCQRCHPGEVEEWAKTGHGVIFKREIDGGADPATSHYGEGCIRCHTTGYYIGAANGGFADIQARTGWKFPSLQKIQSGKGNWDAMPAELKAMANIQCEACHGPAKAHVESRAPMDKSLDERLCYTWQPREGGHVRKLQAR